jgi:hypothetical protein
MSKRDQNPKPYTATSLAEAAGVTFSYVARLCRRGDIDCIKVGGIWIIDRETGKRWLEARQEP